jgi:hypothetical protein
MFRLEAYHHVTAGDLHAMVEMRAKIDFESRAKEKLS